MLSAPVTTTPPAGEVISLAQAKSYLRVDGDVFDVEVGIMAAAAVQDLEEMTGARLLNQQVRVTADRFEELAQLRVAPVREIVSIHYRDVDGAEQLLAPERYALFGSPFEQGVRPLGPAWPAIGAAIDSAVPAVSIVLDVGYGLASSDVPPKLIFACYALLRGKFEDEEVDVAPLVASHRFWL